ncbi:MAG: CocE/NonD family hydrolase [Thermoleophilaceae bacterium]
MGSLLAPVSAHAAPPPAPFGHSCQPQNGVLFCPTNTLADRVPSFEGTPLDVDVTLPANAKRGQALPTIVIMHGWGGSKKSYESTSPEGSTSTTYHWNNVYFAQRGYAVLTYTARGFGRSCGKEEQSANTPDCQAHRSYIHLADQRWEDHDTQYLLGLLADQKVTRPDAIGATGISYGGGQSIELAYLRNRTRLTNGTFAPWKSPGGKSLSLTAAFPRWPWSDLNASLDPNGRFLDSATPSPTESRNPIGVFLESYNSGLFALGQSSGTYCGAAPRPPCDDDSADIQRWFARTQAGEPETPDARAIADEIFNFHQGFGLSGATPPPLLIENGWTDDLFPPREGIRVYRDVGSKTPVSLQFGDLGHSRGSNKANSDHYFNDQGSAFFDHYLKRSSSSAPAPGSVTAFTQTCPKTADGKGPFTGSSYDTLAKGQVSFSDGSSQTVSSDGGNPPTGANFDPIANTDACKQTDEETAPGTAVVQGDTVTQGQEYTLLGLPKVTATIATTGNSGQLDSRLWDVGPDGNQMLVSRGAYRLTDNQTGQITFQLNGGGWCFQAGHRPKLELLGKDEPYLRPSNFPFVVQVSGVSVSLPTAEATQSGCAG